MENQSSKSLSKAAALMLAVAPVLEDAQGAEADLANEVKAKVEQVDPKPSCNMKAIRAAAEKEVDGIIKGIKQKGRNEIGAGEVSWKDIPEAFQHRFEEGGVWRIGTIKELIFPMILEKHITTNILSLSGDVIDGRVDVKILGNLLGELTFAENTLVTGNIESRLRSFLDHKNDVAKRSEPLDKGKLQDSLKDRMPFLLQMGGVCSKNEVFVNKLSEKALSWNLSFLKGKSKKMLVKDLLNNEEALNAFTVAVFKECDSFLESHYEENPNFGWGINNISNGMHRLFLDSFLAKNIKEELVTKD